MRIYVLPGILLVLMLACQPARAAYNADVSKVANWAEAAGKIAIAPAMCPSDFDCVWLNETMADYVGADGYPFTAGPRQVSQAMLEAGVESLDGEGAKQVADLLGVDSILIVAVGNAETRTSSAIAIPIYGGGFMMSPNNRAQGGLEFRVITPEGRTLARGAGFGESGWRKGRGVVGKVFGTLIDELIFD